jgi:hypothetical protein
MCVGVSLSRSEVPTELMGRFRLGRRVHVCGGQEEIRFLLRDHSPRLPVWRDGRLLVVRWGNTRRQSRILPPGGWTWLRDIQAGAWKNLPAESVVIPASSAFEGGVWYHVREGLRGVLVPDERGWAVCYVVCEPATVYYRNMTRSERMPVFIGERF